MTNAHRVNVRLIAEFATEGGDLSRGAMAIERMQDGLRGHKELQSQYTGGYKSEVPVRLDTECLGMAFAVFGRIDGLNEEVTPPVVEEIKTASRDVHEISDTDYPAHWAQAEIYAHIIATTRGADFVSVRLTYHNLGTESVRFTRTLSRAALEEKFFAYLAPYAEWAKTQAEWADISVPTMRALAFPYGDYRAGQREMAANAFTAFKSGKNLLCQAPTGIGKTAAALYPAIKAKGEGLVETVFYLTARGTGLNAAESALNRMRAQGLKMRSVTLTARDKICPMPGATCDPDDCPLARGYFDRRRAALYDGAELEHLDKDAILKLAERHDVCPFELSLDLSEIADVVIGDYNYAFDPVVKLKRYFMDGGAYALLIDEAHNLIDRARDFLSSEINEKPVAELRKLVGREDGRKGGLYKLLTNLLKQMQLASEGIDEDSVLLEFPQALVAALELFYDQSRAFMDARKPYYTQLSDLSFASISLLRAYKRYGDDYRTIITPGKGRTHFKLWCYNPSKYLRECMRRVRGCVLFSATLSPIRFYAESLGIVEGEGDAMLTLQSPFPPQNLLTLQLSIDTRYRQRERSAPDVARAILAMCRAKAGNYIACFPSYAYLRMVHQHLSMMDNDFVECAIQQSAMDERERAAFLKRFEEPRHKSFLALIAMGGVFSEGIDLPGEMLIGAAIIGVGIPQIGFERNALAELLNDTEQGYEYAYVYPGIERVLQAAGRVIRTEADRGCLLLIDQRFGYGEYPDLLPPHYRVKSVKSAAAAQLEMERFWTEEDQ